GPIVSDLMLRDATQVGDCRLAPLLSMRSLFCRGDKRLGGSRMAATLTIGDIEITALSDGPLPATLDSFIEFPRHEAQRLSGWTGNGSHFLPVNAFLLKRAGKFALIDTGAGVAMGPSLGQLPNNLRALGIAPESIDTVLLTHIHPDHALGLVDASGG